MVRGKSLMQNGHVSNLGETLWQEQSKACEKKNGSRRVAATMKLSNLRVHPTPRQSRARNSDSCNLEPLKALEPTL